MSVAQSLLTEFENDAIDPAGFGHRDHLQLGWEMLRCYPFVEAVARYAAGLKELAAAAGAPDKYNTTITVAFLSLIAERMARAEGASFAAFMAANRDLADRDILLNWYPAELLFSDLARRQFVMPAFSATAEWQSTQ